MATVTQTVESTKPLVTFRAENGVGIITMDDHRRIPTPMR